METTTTTKPTITLDDAYKLDVRICKILTVEDILKNPKKEKSDENPVKAYKLTIDTGTEQRTVVTNVVGMFAPSDLEGKQSAFILNLEPATIRGVESRGMIMLAGSSLIGGNTGDVVL